MKTIQNVIYESFLRKGSPRAKSLLDFERQCSPTSMSIHANANAMCPMCMYLFLFQMYTICLSRYGIMTPTACVSSR